MKSTYCLFIFLLFCLKGNAQAPNNKLWDYRYGGASAELPAAIIQTLDNGFLIGGYSFSSVSFDKTDSTKGNADYWIVKTDSTGNILWNKTYGGRNGDYMTCAIALPDSGYLLGGFSNSDSSGDKTQNNKSPGSTFFDFWVIRIDKIGNKIWDKTFGGEQNDNLHKMLMLNNNSFLLGGATSSDSTADMSHHSYGNRDYWIVKMDSSGNKLWDFNYGGTLYDYLYTIHSTSDNGFILGGESKSPANSCKSQDSISPANDYWILKVDSNGLKVWDKTIGGDAVDNFSDLLILPGDKILICGTSNSAIGFDKSEMNHGNISFDFWIVKTDSLGNKLWDKVYGGIGNDDAIYNVSKINNGFLLTGTSYCDISGDKSEYNIFNNEQGWTIAIDTLGNKMWDKTLPSNAHVEFCQGLQTKDSCFVFLSFTDIDGGDVSQERESLRDYWFVKYCFSNLPTPNFISAKRTICQKNCHDFINLSANATTYQWFFPGGNPSSSTLVNPQQICYDDTGKFEVTLIAINNIGSDTLTFPNYITVSPQIPVSIITQNYDTLFSISGYFSYQWYFDSTLISGATSYYYRANLNGNYSVLITDSNGCSVLVEKQNVITDIAEMEKIKTEIKVFYSAGIIYLNVNSVIESPSFLELTDALGRITYRDKIILQKGKNAFTIPINTISKGIYFVKVWNSKQEKTQKLIIN